MQLKEPAEGLAAGLIGAATAGSADGCLQAALPLLGEGGAIYLYDPELDLLMLRAGNGPVMRARGESGAWAALASGEAFTGEGRCWAPIRGRPGAAGVMEMQAGERAAALGAVLGAVLGAALEQHRQALALAQAEALLGTLSDTMSEGLVVATTTGEFLRINARMEALCGWSAEELRRLGWFDCLYPNPEDRARAVASARGAFQGQPAAGVPWRIWHRSGRPVEVVLTSRILALEGQPACIVALFSEQATPAVAPAQERFEDLRRLAGAVAHDVNNLAAAIQGHAELLSMEPYPSVKDRARTILGTVLRAQTLTRQLSSFGREQTLRRITVSLLTLAEGIAAEQRPAAPKGADDPDRFRLEVSGDRSLMADVDPVAFQQLLLALIGYARERSGRVQVQVAAAALPDRPLRSYAAAGVAAWVRVRVEDGGPGIPIMQRGRIFEPFQRGGSTLQGLGMVMVDRIAEQHRGVLDLPEAGSCVDFYLPAARPAAEEPMRRDPEAGGSERVWVVDDEPAVRDWIVQALRTFGYSARGFDGGPELLGALERGGEYDVLICDLSMPGMDGLELYRRLRLRGLRRPVLFCSGYSARAGEVPVGRDVDFLQKPVPTRILAQRVRRLLNYIIPGHST